MIHAVAQVLAKVFRPASAGAAAMDALERCLEHRAYLTAAVQKGSPHFSRLMGECQGEGGSRDGRDGLLVAPEFWVVNHREYLIVAVQKGGPHFSRLLGRKGAEGLRGSGRMGVRHQGQDMLSSAPSAGWLGGKAGCFHTPEQNALTAPRYYTITV